MYVYFPNLLALPSVVSECISSETTVTRLVLPKLWTGFYQLSFLKNDMPVLSVVVLFNFKAATSAIVAMPFHGVAVYAMEYYLLSAR
jgi:hypothetical protein